MDKTRIQELFDQYIDVLKEWQIKLAIARIQKFGVPPDDWDDAMQELALMIRRFRFDPAKAHAASEETITCRMIDFRIRMLLRRDSRYQSLIERVGQMRIETEDREQPETSAFAADLRQAVAQLTPKQQEICRALMNGDSAEQIAERVDRHPTTIREHIRRIRCILAEQGFDPCQE